MRTEMKRKKKRWPHNHGNGIQIIATIAKNNSYRDSQIAIIGKTKGQLGKKQKI